MKVLNLFDTENKEYWLSEIEKGDWGAANYLYHLISNGTFEDMVGEDPQVLLLTEGDSLMAFCTYAKYDDIKDHSVSPWAGFVYTFPKYRGMRRAGKLLEHAYMLAKKDGYKELHISTDKTGLYEKYGFSFWKLMEDITGEQARIYKMDIVEMDYGSVIGKRVKGTIDRPLGSSHPDYPDMIYPINYGYVDGITGGDGEEQDVYVFGTEEATGAFEGEVIGVVHRLNDCEDKWIVSINGEIPAKEEILSKIAFQEQFYMSELYM